jgi:hypothetical protein
MISVSRSVPVSGLGDLSTESRVIATPWSRMLRGIGLGQYPIDYDAQIAAWIREHFDLLAAKVSSSDAYTRVCRDLANFILRIEESGSKGAWIEQAVDRLIESVRSVSNPYYRAMAGSIVMDAFAKLDLSPLLVGERRFPAEVLRMLDQIAPDQIADENQGRHGEYERLSASCGVFLSLGQIGARDLLVTAERNHIVEILDLLEGVPTPYFRGRVCGVLLSVIAVLGYTEYVFDGDRDYMAETLEYLSRADEVNIWPTFHNPITTPWKKVYPLLTMLNAIALCDRPEYLTRPFDTLAEAKDLLAQIPWETRIHMAQYYVIALDNLGLLEIELPDLDAFLRDVAAVLDEVDPGENYSPRGNAYPYIIELSMMTGRMDLIPEDALHRMVDSFPDLQGEINRANSAFPMSYVINILGEIGAPELLFEPRDRYAGRTALAWVIENMSEGAEAEGDRVSMIDHALVSYALRLRGADASETELFASFRVPSARSPLPNGSTYSGS